MKAHSAAVVFGLERACMTAKDLEKAGDLLGHLEFGPGREKALEGLGRSGSFTAREVSEPRKVQTVGIVGIRQKKLLGDPQRFAVLAHHAQSMACSSERTEIARLARYGSEIRLERTLEVPCFEQRIPQEKQRVFVVWVGGDHALELGDGRVALSFAQQLRAFLRGVPSRVIAWIVGASDRSSFVVVHRVEDTSRGRRQPAPSMRCAMLGSPCG